MQYVGKALVQSIFLLWNGPRRMLLTQVYEDIQGTDYHHRIMGDCTETPRYVAVFQYTMELNSCMKHWIVLYIMQSRKMYVLILTQECGCYIFVRAFRKKYYMITINKRCPHHAYGTQSIHHAYTARKHTTMQPRCCVLPYVFICIKCKVNSFIGSWPLQKAGNPNVFRTQPQSARVAYYVVATKVLYAYIILLNPSQ